MTEKDIDNFIAETLQKHRIDFVRIKNSNFRGGMRNYNTSAYDEPFSCDKNYPDFTFPYGGRVHMIENGLRHGKQLSNQSRKNRQIERMVHWAKHGGCECAVISSIDMAVEYFRNIGISV